jgi:hypothetical protein
VESDHHTDLVQLRLIGCVKLVRADLPDDESGEWDGDTEKRFVFPLSGNADNNGIRFDLASLDIHQRNNELGGNFLTALDSVHILLHSMPTGEGGRERQVVVALRDRLESREFEVKRQRNRRPFTRASCHFPSQTHPTICRVLKRIF